MAIHINIRNWTYYLFKIEEFSGNKTKSKIKCLDRITISFLAVKTVYSMIATTLYEYYYYSAVWSYVLHMIELIDILLFSIYLIIVMILMLK